MARTGNGTSDGIQFGSEAAVDNLMGYTTAAIIRITANVVDERAIFSKFRSDYGAGRLFISAVGDGVTNNQIFTLVATTATAVQATSVANILAVNTWKVIITTWPGVIGGTQAKIYSCTLGGDIAEASYASFHAGSGSNLDDSASTIRLMTRDPLDTFYAGGLAECALWNRVLTADEMRAIGKGYAPAFFPIGRLMYAPLRGRVSPEPNWNGSGSAGTLTGTSYLDHPPIIYPHSNVWRNKAAIAAAAAGQPYAKRLAGVPWMTPTRFSGVW